MAKARDDYNGLVPRKIAVVTCLFGMLELLAAIIVIICAFVLFGGFCEQLDCKGHTKGLGLWLGFPLIIPSLLAIVVLGTRHIQSLAAFGITNVVMLILSITHAVLVYQDDQDYWSKYVTAFDGNKCQAIMTTKCTCPVDNANVIMPFACELIQFGSDVNWVLFAFSIVSIIISFIGVVLAIIGYNVIPPKPRN